MAETNDTYAVMGDLGGGNYIVRMYVSGHVIDEEFTANGVTELADKIIARMSDLSKGEYKKVGTQTDNFKSDGHAIPMTPETGATT